MLLAVLQPLHAYVCECVSDNAQNTSHLIPFAAVSRPFFQHIRATFHNCMRTYSKQTAVNTSSTQSMNRLTGHFYWPPRARTHAYRFALKTEPVHFVPQNVSQTPFTVRTCVFVSVCLCAAENCQTHYTALLGIRFSHSLSNNSCQRHFSVLKIAGAHILWIYFLHCDKISTAKTAHQWFITIYFVKQKRVKGTR